MNLRKDHSHEQSNFTVNLLCERLGGMPVAYAVVPMQNSRVAKQVRYFVFLLVPAAACLHFNICLAACYFDVGRQSMFTTFSDGCLGSSNDEGRSEV